MKCLLYINYYYYYKFSFTWRLPYYRGHSIDFTFKTAFKKMFVMRYPGFLKCYFIAQISITTHHRNLIDPSLYFINHNYYTVTENSMLFFQFQRKTSQKYSHLTSCLITWINFRKSNAKWFLCPSLACVEKWSYLQIK